MFNIIKDNMEISIMILTLLIMLLGFLLYKKYPELRKRIKERRLEADYFRKMSKR
jgi:hypothetical protein